MWDIDDVLNPLMQEWLEHQKHTKKVDLEFKYTNLENPDFSESLNWSRKDFIDSLDEFRLNFQATLEPNNLIQKWFMEGKLKDVHHAALTATPQKFSNISKDWLQRNFGQYINDFYLAPSARNDDLQPRLRKYDFYKEFKGKYSNVIVIDDRPDNLESAKAAGVSTLCWPQPWNHSLLDSKATLKELSRTILEWS